MSLMRLKPKYCEFVEATNHGWINSKTGELLVSFKGLKDRLDAELAEQKKTEVPVPSEEIKMNETPVFVEEKVEVIKAPKALVKEQTVKRPRRSQKIIAEVVEYDSVDMNIIGESNGG